MRRSRILERAGARSSVNLVPGSYSPIGTRIFLVVALAQLTENARSKMHKHPTEGGLIATTGRVALSHKQGSFGRDCTWQRVRHLIREHIRTRKPQRNHTSQRQLFCSRRRRQPTNRFKVANSRQIGQSRANRFHFRDD